MLATDADELVAKAFVLPEVARTAQAELRLKQLLLAKWRLRGRQAAVAARSAVLSGKSAVSAVDKAMGRFPKDVAKPFGASIEKIYRLSRKAGWKKGSRQTNAPLQYSGAMMDALNGIKVSKASNKPVNASGAAVALLPTFDLVDEAAIEALQQDQFIWIAGHYERNVRDAVREKVREAVEAGVGRREMAAAVAAAVKEVVANFSLPAGFKGSDQDYFEGVAANVATNARVRGKLRSFEQLGVTTYVLVNPMDNRTSPICLHLNGKVFSVQNGLDQVAAEAGATSPEDVKSVHPFLTMGQILAISPSAGDAGLEDSQALADAGVALPPFHMRCRTTVDVVFESASFAQLEGVDLP